MLAVAGDASTGALFIQVAAAAGTLAGGWVVIRKAGPERRTQKESAAEIAIRVGDAAAARMEADLAKRDVAIVKLEGALAAAIASHERDMQALRAELLAAHHERDTATRERDQLRAELDAMRRDMQGRTAGDGEPIDRRRSGE